VVKENEKFNNMRAAGALIMLSKLAELKGVELEKSINKKEGVRTRPP
jgi:hypothetical protein